MRPGVLAAAFLLLASSIFVGTVGACSAGSDKDGNKPPPPPGDSGLDVTTGLCNVCTGTVFTPCDAKGNPLPGIECAPKICVGGKGCLNCPPGGKICVGNEIHTCTDAGEPGPLVKPCDVSGGELCSNGECKRACDVAAEQPSNVGCEFWAVDLDNEYSDFNDAAGAPWGIVLSNAGGANASVTIEKNDAAPGEALKVTTVKTLTLKAGEIQSVILPTREVDGSVLGKDDGPGTWLSSNAYRITSTAPLVVYQFNAMAQIFSNDASLLIPRNGLGQIYRVLGWYTANPIAGIPIAGIPDHSFVTIVGVTAGTKVTVTLSHAIVKGGKIPATPKGGKVEVTLGPFDVLNLESDGIDGNMTGTIVEATAPIAVFTGGERGSAPYEYPDPPPGFDQSKICCTDHLEEQLLPVTSMGKKFVVTRSPIRSTGGYVEPDVLRFMGVAATTAVTTNLPAPDDKFTLEPGKFRDVHTKVDCVVEATEPLAIGQVMVSQAYTNAPISGGDPSLTIFPPIDQWRADYLFNVPTSWDRNYVVIAAQVGSEVKIDGAVPSDCVVANAGKIGTVDYEARRCPLKAGAHRMVGPKAFGIAAYGYGPVGSYAFIGGADVKKIYEPPPLK